MHQQELPASEYQVRSGPFEKFESQSPVAHLYYILGLADDALVIGHRISEWCGHGPILEQDIALTNMALDHLGRARNLYQYAADLIHHLPTDLRAHLFRSLSLQNKINAGDNVDEDDLAYLRDAWDFRNLLLLEQPNEDWAYTTARSFLYDAFNFAHFTALQQSSDITLAAIAEKSLKEITYHLKWSSEWMLRLGDGTDESHEKLQLALNDLWMYTGEQFTATDNEQRMLHEKVAPDLAGVKRSWSEKVNEILIEATMTLPGEKWMQQGGRSGRHSEHLGYILAELQFLQRAYPGYKW
jgi:ring-1,2-phenylacetyl-CoA epoxidase subunit PaaC